MLNREVKISKRAYASMLCELEEYPNVETGGILLGYDFAEGYDIVEATDPGFFAVRETGNLQCDMKYLQHILHVLNRIYNPPLEQIGVWHKHNHAYEPPFSETDQELHKKVAAQKQRDILSILFQKKEDDEYAMRVFKCGENGEIEEVEFEVMDLEAAIGYEYM